VMHLRVPLPKVRYVETDRGYRLDVGRVSINQSAFLLLAAIIVGVGGGYGAVGFRYLILLEQQLGFGLFAPALHAIGRAQVLPVLIAAACSPRSS